ncbi:hypothetical protein [Ktedonospora formicarum]|uniref:Uncharacterized protein n=1 Tax=Ktedonospora formicarum TaxID=2778364 RepID=A0A8J3MST1_9CHLR|nr:hypothetical protein [Ktedonospora formicarum]GHO45176.1 hypothetical protein KSX_33390 [Ktedonospora formicarum]
MKTQVTIQETYTAMSEILHGDNEPSVLLAFWASALSKRVKLTINGQYVRILAEKYLENGLPEDQEELKDTLGRKPGNKFPAGLMQSHIDCLYALESLHKQGLLNFDAGNTLESQQAWREKMVALIPGMACKLVSWALFIYNPLYTKLLTIDTWHCKRLGIDQEKLAGKTKAKVTYYLATEKRMLAECQALYPEYPPVVTAAMLWENARIAGGESDGQAYTSHKEISCRWY